MEKGSMELLERIAEKMLRDVYHPISLCVWLNEQEMILDAVQFDAQFCIPRFAFHADATACWLISNHHNGDMRPFAEDISNRNAASWSIKNRNCSLFLFSEDTGFVDRTKW